MSVNQSFAEQLEVRWYSNGEQSLCCVLSHDDYASQIPVLCQLLAMRLRKLSSSGTDIIPCQDSITLVSADEQTLLYLKQQCELLLFQSSDDLSVDSRLHEIAICYDDRLDTDLTELAAKLDMEKTEIIERHHRVEYRVDMLGFLPGFFYLSGLDDSLKIARKTTPAVKLPAGSVAIAEQMSGIYSLVSPGGWWVVGQTPETLFDIHADPPVAISPLDRIRFRPIEYAEFMERKA